MPTKTAISAISPTTPAAAPCNPIAPIPQEAGELIGDWGIGAFGLQGAAAGVVGDIAEIAVFVGIGVCKRSLQPAKVFPKGKGMRTPHLGEVVGQLIRVADAMGVGPSLRAGLDDVADGEVAESRGSEGSIVAVWDTYRGVLVGSVVIAEVESIKAVEAEP